MSPRVALLLFLLALIAGCKTESSLPSLGDDYGGAGAVACLDHDGDGFGIGCAKGIDCDDGDATITNQCYVCAHDEPGCACAAEGTRVGCGKVTARVGNQTTCGYGETECTNGKWGECVLTGGTTQTFTTSSRAPLGLAPPTACVGNPCDPFCKEFADTPDKTLGGTGLVATDAGLTTGYIDGGPPPLLPNGPMPQRIKNTLVDAGLYPDATPDVIIYHELPPPATAQDPVTVTASTKSVDVYFLESTRGNSYEEDNVVENAFNNAGGIYDQVRRVIPDARFGVGRYEQYDQWPWNRSGKATVPYAHLQSMTGTRNQAYSALSWNRMLADWDEPSPRSWIEAIFAEATGGGLLRGTRTPWVPARSAFRSEFNSETGACPAGTIGYPCFRADALPITVLVADAPANNGPGGEFAYARDGDHIVDGAANWAGATPQRITGNATEATAYTIDPTKFAIFTGTTADGQANQTWQRNSPDTGDTGDPPSDRALGCANGWFDSSPNVFYKFTVTQRTFFHFDTVGSAYTPIDPDYGTAIYLYQRTAAGTAGIACNYSAFFHDSSKPNMSSIEGYVDAGTYYLVIDGIYGSKGAYVLHVNAMADGSALAAPNYDEVLSAYNAIGGKVVGVDTSGNGCSGGVEDYVQTFTGAAVEKLVRDTASVDATSGNPFVVHLSDPGGVCKSTDPTPANQIASAILGLANARMNVSAVGFDKDDAVDFDGPGGATMLTPINIDDATFIRTISAIPTPEASTGCQQVLADRFVGCLPGTHVTFSVTFRTPAAVPALSREQIFEFMIRTLRDGAIVLSETPVVIVVPPSGPFAYTDAWFVRDYDASGACPAGTAPLWSLFTWNASTPGDSHIDLDVAVGASTAELATAPIDPLLFSDGTGPSALVGQGIGVRTRAPAGPDTQLGGTVVDSTLATNMRARDSRMLRLRAHLVPSTDRMLAPTLKLWDQRISCQPAE